MSQSQIATLQVGGITCAGCVATLNRVLKALPGVEDVMIEQASGVTQVRYAVDVAQPASFAAAIEDAGYDVESTL